MLETFPQGARGESQMINTKNKLLAGGELHKKLPPKNGKAVFLIDTSTSRQMPTTSSGSDAIRENSTTTNMRSSSPPPTRLQ